MTINLDNFRVRPGHFIHLDQIDPESTGSYVGSKSDAGAETDRLSKALDNLQEALFAGRQRALLVILQGMDTSGKDGAIRHVFASVNPQGVSVANFKVPTPAELSHDFLWRTHLQTPARGEIAIFNRSYYEDVLIVRVHDLVPEQTWRKRFGHINDFERMLTDEGTTILKFFLHISRQEQKDRLVDRLDKPNKHWKFNPEDLKERRLWDDYMAAYQDAINQTSSDWAPWYIVPANRKWFRNLVIASVLVDALQQINPHPVSDFSDQEIKKYRAELEK